MLYCEGITDCFSEKVYAVLISFEMGASFVQSSMQRVRHMTTWLFKGFPSWLLISASQTPWSRWRVCCIMYYFITCAWKGPCSSKNGSEVAVYSCYRINFGKISSVSNIFAPHYAKTMLEYAQSEIIRPFWTILCFFKNYWECPLAPFVRKD